MKIKRTVKLGALLIILATTAVRADAPSKNLVAVSISTGAGIFEGFTAWADDEPWELLGKILGERPASDPCANGWYSPGCLKDEDILSMLKKKKRLYFIWNVEGIKHPQEAFVTSVAPESLPSETIKSITLRKHKLNGYRWYGRMMKLSSNDIALLQTPPFFQCQIYGVQYPVYWMSYTKRYGKDELKDVCDQELTVENKNRINALTDKLDREPELIRLDFPWD